MKVLTIPDAQKSLKEEGIARFHYLFGPATFIDLEDGTYELEATAIYPATEEYPTVLDRSKNTNVYQAHVNFLDTFQATWNAAKLIEKRIGIGIGNLKGNPTTRFPRVVYPDTDYKLKCTVKLGEPNELHREGTLESNLYREDGKRVARLKGEWTTQPLYDKD